MHNFDKNDILSRLYSGTALVSVLWLVSGLIATPAQAACTGAAGIYSCDGALTDPVTINDTNISITTQSGFGIAVTGQDPALSLIGAGFVSYQDDNLSPLSGPAGALHITNSAQVGTAFASIVTGGNIDGDIVVDNQSFQGDVQTEIVLSGTSLTSPSDGIFVNSSANGGNNTLRIDATNIQAVSYGIRSYQNASDGDVLSEISVSGAVAVQGDGIQSTTIATGGNNTVRINANEIHARRNAIVSTNYSFQGDALTEIVATGTITADQGDGINSSGYADGANSTVQIKAADIQAGSNGICPPSTPMRQNWFN